MHAKPDRTVKKKALQSVLYCVLALMTLLAAWPAMAATYAYRNDTFSYDTPTTAAKTVAWHTSGAAPVCTGYPNGDDDWVDITFANATTPANNFTFTFAGVVQTGVRIYSNGILVFGNDTTGYWRNYTNTTLPATATATAFTGCTSGLLTNAIAGYWNDIVAGTANNTTGASVQYELLGTAPNRRLVISWVNVKLYGQTARYNFQIALYESPAGGLNSNFKYQYTTGSSTGADATVGVQVSTTDSTLYAFNQAFIDPTIGSAILWHPANQLAGKSAEYRFDENSWNGTAGEVKDTSGSERNAVRTGAATNVATGKICRGGSFTANTSNAVIDAVATPIAPTSVGSQDFWFNSNLKWNTSDAMLFDATAAAARPFFFMKTAAGALKFTVTDSSGTILTVSSPAQTYAANTWHHVGVSWNLRPGTNQTLLQIFLDGTLVASLRTTSNGTITALSTIYIGDNRTSGITPSGGTPNGANGFIDEINIYSTEINANQALADMNATHACTSVDHFQITHNGSAVTCDIAPVTIEAHDASHNPLSLSGVTLNLSTSTGNGNWSNISGGSVSTITNNGNGSATYVFSNESSVTFGLQDTVAESLTIGATAGTVTTTSGSATPCTATDYTFGNACNAPLTFALAGFRFIDSAGNPIVNQVAGVTSATYYLQAIKQGTTTGACTAYFPTGTAANIDLASECNNAGTCQAGQAVTFTPGTGAGISGTIATNANGSISATTGTYTTKPLIFNAASPAPTPSVPFTFSYSDVGQIRLWARYTPLTGATISGSTQFIVAPKSFKLTGITAAPIKAGKPFNGTVTAINGAGNTTPNFGKESTPEGVNLSFAKCQPTGSGAVNGSFSGSVGAFNSGSATSSNLTWSEVGNIDLIATLASANYLGSGLTATGNSGATGTTCSGSGSAGMVGRFTPDHFDTIVTQGCPSGNFTYSAQPFTVQVTAKNGLATPTTTANYDGTSNTSPNFAKTVTLSDSTASPLGTLSANSVAVSSFSAGVASPTPKYTFTSPATAPTTITLRATDTDSITSQNFTEGTAPIRSGRLKLSNASGSEALALPVPLLAQYYNGTTFVTNTIDNCTTIPTPTTPTASNGLLTTLTTTATLQSPLVSGDGKLKLSKPGAAGYVDITITAPAWLQYNWKGTGASNPTARATFGIYKNANEFIYMREMY